MCGDDAHWLATLARAGLLRGSFVPPAKWRELRLIARQQQKLTGQLASEKNRLHKHKVLTDSGIRLGVVVSDLHGQSARAMVKAIIAGQPPHEILKLASRRLKASREEILDALQGELTESHYFALDELMQHIEEIEARIARFDTKLLDELKDERNTPVLLQTLPSVDLMGATMLLVEIGTDMDTFGTASQLSSWVGICPGNHESAGYSASSLMPPVVPDQCSNRSSSLSSSGVDVNARSWLSATKYYALHSLLHAQTARTLLGFDHRL
jgi:hypothetical protein